MSGVVHGRVPAPIAFDTGLMVPMAGVPWASAAPTSHLVLRSF